MDRRKACRILGIPLNCDRTGIKAAYRKRISEAHPDTGAPKGEYSAYEINEAYAWLRKEEEATTTAAASQEKKAYGKKEARNTKVKRSWDAKENPNAFCERAIYHPVEDENGTMIGRIALSLGRYYWCMEEEFPLFLYSLYECGRKLLEEVDAALGRTIREERRMRIQPELTYLLAGQFIDHRETLQMLLKDKVVPDSPVETYMISAMLETDLRIRIKKGEAFYPAGVKDHRLYIRRGDGRLIGYLSFRDDRLYYVLIPLFEQQDCQVRILAGDPDKQKREKPVTLYLRLIPKEKKPAYPENVNQKIHSLLERYREEDCFDR